MIGPNMATMLAFVLHRCRRRRRRPRCDSFAAAADRSFQLHQRRGPHEHQRHRLALRQRRGPRLQGDALARFEERRHATCAPSWPGPSPPTPRARRTSSRSRSKACAPTPRRAVAKAVAESALVKTAIFGADPELGPHRLGGGLCRRRVRGKRPVALAGRLPALQRRRAQPFDAEKVSRFIKSTREIPVRLLFTLGARRANSGPAI